MKNKLNKGEKRGRLTVVIALFMLSTFLFLFNSVSAEKFGYGNTKDIPINYSLIPTVNNSQFLQGLTPIEVADLFDASAYWKSDGTSTATGNWNLGNYNLTANTLKTGEYDYGLSKLIFDTNAGDGIISWIGIGGFQGFSFNSKIGTSSIDFGTNEISDGSMIGNWNFGNYNLSGINNLTASGTGSVKDIVLTGTTKQIGQAGNLDLIEFTDNDEVTINNNLKISNILYTNNIRAVSGEVDFNNDNITTTGNITADTYFGDGSQLTGVESTDAELDLTLDNSLVSWWRMDDNESTKVVDYMGKNNGTATNDAYQNDGYLGKGWYFDGTDDHINITSYTDIPVGNSARTLSIWVNSQTTTGVGTANQIFGSGLTGCGNWLMLNWENYAISVTYSCHRVSSPAGALNNDEWYHVLLRVPEGSTDTDDPELFINGVEQSLTKVGGAGTQTLNTIITGFGIGGTDSYDGFIGALDDAMIFNRSLSDDEIKQLYEMGRLDNETAVDMIYAEDYVSSKSGIFNKLNSLVGYVRDLFVNDLEVEDLTVVDSITFTNSMDLNIGSSDLYSDNVYSTNMVDAYILQSTDLYFSSAYGGDVYYDNLYENSYVTNKTDKEAYELYKYATENYIVDGVKNYSVWGECYSIDERTDYSRPENKTEEVCEEVCDSNSEGVSYNCYEECETIITDKLYYPHKIFVEGTNVGCKLLITEKAMAYQTGIYTIYEDLMDVDTKLMVEDIYFQSKPVNPDVDYTSIFSDAIPFFTKHASKYATNMTFNTTTLEGDNVEEQIKDLQGYVLQNEFCRNNNKKYDDYNTCMDNGETLGDKIK